MNIKSLLLAVVMVGALCLPASAQTQVKLWANGNSGSITASAQNVAVTNARGQATFGVQISGTFSGVLTPQCSIDGTNWVSLSMTSIDSGSAVSTFTSTGAWYGSISTCNQVRVLSSNWVSGTASVYLDTSQTSIAGIVNAEVLGGNSAASDTGAAVPSDADYLGVKVGSNLVGVSGLTVGSTNAVTVAIVDDNGDQLVNLGGGTQYTEADTDATITGTAIMFESNTVTSALSVVSGSTPLPVGDAGGSLTVDGTVTVTDGAGALNVIVDSGSVTVSDGAGALNVIVDSSALPSGASTSAKQDTAITALQIIDDLPNTINSTTSGQSGILMQGAVTTAAPTYTTLKTNPLSLQTDGSLRVALTNGSTGGTSGTDNSAFTAGVTSATPIGGFYHATPDTVTDGRFAAVGLTSKRAMFVTLFNSTGTEMTQDTQAIFGGALSWNAGTGPTGGLGAWCRVSAAAPSTTGVIDDDVTIKWCDANGRLHITGDASMTALIVGGAVAHDAVSSGNSVPIGGKADSSLSDNTPVATGDRTDAFFDLDGALITRPWAPLADLIQARTTNTDGASTSLIASAGASIFQYLTYCTFSNTSATAITIDLRDGTGGSIVWSGPVPANTNGAHIIFPTPLKFSAATAIAFDGSAAASTITVACGGFKSKAG